MNKQRETYVRKAQQGLINRVKRLQNEVYAILTQRIDSLSVDEEGQLVNTITNIAQAERLAIVAEKEVAKRNKGLVGWLVGKLRPLFKLNKKHFERITPLKETDNERAIRLVLRRWGYDTINGDLISGGYLESLSGSGPIKRDVLNRVNAALSGNMDLKTFRAIFRKDFTGEGGLGMMDRYFTMNTRDIFHQVDRQTQLIYASRLKLKYALWSHTIRKTSTVPCRKRSGLVYDIETIRSWDNLTWPGKKGSYLIDGHGFGCYGHWNFMSNETAETYKKRNKVNVFNDISKESKKKG